MVASRDRSLEGGLALLVISLTHDYKTKVLDICPNILFSIPASGILRDRQIIVARG